MHTMAGAVGRHLPWGSTLGVLAPEHSNGLCSQVEFWERTEDNLSAYGPWNDDGKEEGRGNTLWSLLPFILPSESKIPQRS